MLQWLGLWVFFGSVKIHLATRRLYRNDALSCPSFLATGVSPRLRLPLPENLADETLNFLKDRRGPESERYLYPDLSETELAERGSTAPIGGFVLLEREEGAEVKITPLDDSEILHHAVR
ncbi:hypothetical protein MnTg02_01428 [bacterium MnTg02]|nr:hypothetical protein MnTg02_01428 [bacterium MnTg02]